MKIWLHILLWEALVFAVTLAVGGLVTGNWENTLGITLGIMVGRIILLLNIWRIDKHTVYMYMYPSLRGD